MKKSLKAALLLSLTLICVFGLTACGKKTDVKSLSNTQSEVAKEFNELATLINDNGPADEGTTALLNNYSDILAEVAEVCKDPSGYDQAAIDEMEAGLRDMQTVIADATETIQAQIDARAQ